MASCLCLRLVRDEPRWLSATEAGSSRGSRSIDRLGDEGSNELRELSGFRGFKAWRSIVSCRRSGVSVIVVVAGMTVMTLGPTLRPSSGEVEACRGSEGTNASPRGLWRKAVTCERGTIRHRNVGQWGKASTCDLEA